MHRLICHAVAASTFVILAAAPASRPGLAQTMPDFSLVGSSVAGITIPVVLNPCPAACVAATRVQASPALAPGGAGTAYPPTPALARQTQTAFLDRLGRADPAAARALSAQLERHDYQAVWRELAKGTGMRDGDAADAQAAHMVLCWMIATNAMTDPDPAVFAAVRGQLAPRLAAEPRLAAPGAMAALGEEMKLLSVITHAGWQSARMEGRLAAYADGVAAEFRRTSGQDLRALVLTPSGFVARGAGG